MVFGQSPLLKKHPAFHIENEYRERPVKPGVRVGVHLLGGADVLVVLVDEDHVFNLNFFQPNSSKSGNGNLVYISVPFYFRPLSSIILFS